MKVQYEEIGEPEENGVYATRISDPRTPSRTIDVFLWRIQGSWFLPGPGDEYTGEVHAWIGPLPRVKPLRTDLEAPSDD